MIERRYLASPQNRIKVRKFIRNIGDPEMNTIQGYAAVFNSLSEDLGGFRELIKPGAFSAVLNDDVRALLNHDPNLLLGRTLAKTLKLTEDEIGLRYEISPPNTSYAKDLIESLRRGDLDQSSFGFSILEDSWDTGAGGLPVRTIHRIGQLFDVSPVTFPAYPSSSVEYVEAA